ncbi:MULTISPECIES: hypothetical protein [Streptomyces]|uniref:hypothetical protein n=1 Tax=Streptomyces TaxID=1883 RepID=UPI0006AD1A59|nr:MULTISPECIES: hypothetical protein [Streptomyces]ALC26990.1 hypothetical protein ABE83_07765 [Streptomyces sp. CFMR 7]RZF06919.1 hypothetical protein C0R05_18660 [Streptomyces albidoflavus]
MNGEPIRISRGRGGQVEVEGAIDDFAASVLARAGFDTYPTLQGVWIRLPFDLGRTWENEHSTWAAEMLTAARYDVDLDQDLRAAPPSASAPPAQRRTKAAMTVQSTPPGTSRRQRR